MKRMVIAAWLAAAVPAHAATDAASLFAAGKFAEAVTAGEAEATAASLLIAGRSRLQLASSGITGKAAAHSALNGAITDFDLALAKSPGNVDILLQKAIAQGYNAQLDKSVTGARAMHTAVEAILRTAPGDALAWAVLGSWHGGAVAAVGSFLARTALGANLDAMHAAFAKAMALDPASPAHPTGYALTLLKLSPDNAPQAQALLTKAAALPARDAFEASYKAAGTKLLTVIGDPKLAQATATRIAPFGMVK